MKKILLTLTFISSFFYSFGQKVDLDKYNFTFEFRNLPKSPLLKEYNTYSVNYTSGSTIKNIYGDRGVQNAVNIQGWKKLTDGPQGHALVNIDMDEVNFIESKINERIDIQKDKDGKETGRKYYYSVGLTYKWGVRANLDLFDGARISNKNYGSSQATWSSSEYSKRSEATEYFNNNSSQIRDNLTKTEVNGALAQISEWLSDSYGFAPVKEYEILWIMDSKKHPEQANQQKAWADFKAEVATVTPDSFSEEAKAKFVEIIKYFDGVPATYSKDEKGDKKLRYASFFNKAKMYLYLDNPEAAIKEADALIANDYDAGDGKVIKKQAEALIELFKKNPTYKTRHFIIDLSSATSPSK